MNSNNLFRRIATRVSQWAGSSAVFFGAIIIVLVWASSGPYFNFSDTWQLVINTGTTICTFLMVFLIQNTQNRDGKAVQLKLDELLRAAKGTRAEFVDLEELTDEELAALGKEFRDLATSPAAARALTKLHAKIELERKRRMTLREASGAVAAAILRPITLPLEAAQKLMIKSDVKPPTTPSDPTNHPK